MLGNTFRLIRLGLVQPLLDLYATLSRQRRHRMRSLIMICLCAMLLYYMTYDDLVFLYPYMQLKYYEGRER